MWEKHLCPSVELNLVNRFFLKRMNNWSEYVCAAFKTKFQKEVFVALIPPLLGRVVFREPQTLCETYRTV